MAEPEPFRFFTQRHLIVLTGLKARNLPELLHHLQSVPDTCVFHHTHSHYLSHHSAAVVAGFRRGSDERIGNLASTFERPIVYNEFAAWVSHALQEKRLAEQLAAVDLFSFTSIRDLRQELLQTISRFLQESGGRLRESPPGNEFHFAKSKSFVLPTKLQARTVSEFRQCLPHISGMSLYFHFFEARLRLERRTNDFSAWLSSIGETDLAERIDRLNPYDYTLDELREKIIELSEGDHQRSVGRAVELSGPETPRLPAEEPMTSSLDRYREIVGIDAIQELQVLAEHVHDRELQNISSPAAGSTVSQILTRILPLLQELGVRTRWDLMPGDPRFFTVTKAIHDALHGRHHVSKEMLDIFEAHTAKVASVLDVGDDFILVHDPQPLGLIRNRRAPQTWMWRCHLDLSSPEPYIWSYLKPYIESYDCSIFSMPDFAQQLSIPQYMIAPSIDPLSDRNKELAPEFVAEVLANYGIDPQRPIVAQISRFDRIRDPLGVIATYRLVKKRFNIQLLLAGSVATNDPEVQEMLREVQEYAANDPDCHVIVLPPSSDLTVNALVRGSTIVLQKSIREGFGLTVSEALWKRKPVVGGAVGGIKLQILDGANGFLVHSPEGAANRVVQLLADRDLYHAMSERGYNLVKENFLITRHVKDYLLLMLSAGHADWDTIYLGRPSAAALST